jgi:hypothetical protein
MIRERLPADLQFGFAIPPPAAFLCHDKNEPSLQ